MAQANQGRKANTFTEIDTLADDSAFFVLQKIGGVRKARQLTKEDFITQFVGSFVNPIVVTYAELLALSAANNLRVGAWYKITNATAANIPILIKAISENSFATNAINANTGLSIRYFFDTNSIQSKGLLIGDSTIAEYLGQNGVDVYLLKDGDMFAGATILNQAAPGDTIAQQKSIYLNDADKSEYDYVIIQVGLNDLDPLENASVAIARYQDLVNTINDNKKDSCIIIVSSMLECKSRLTFFYGNTNGLIAYQKLLDINEAIMGGGSTPITGVNYRNNTHIQALNDGEGNLAFIYDVGDLIHETNAGRKIIADAMRKALFKGGLLLTDANDSIDAYFNNNGKDILLKNVFLGMGVTETKLPFHHKLDNTNTLYRDIASNAIFEGIVAGNMFESESGVSGFYDYLTKFVMYCHNGSGNVVDADHRIVFNREFGTIEFPNLPTSSSGLPINSLWNDNGTLKIKL